MGFFKSISKILGPVASIAGTVTGQPWLTAAGSVLGGIAQNDAAEQQSAKQMSFQQYNSDTAYQRATKDMIAAGINPILAASNGGASTPGGSQASISNPLSGIGDAVNSGADFKNKSAQHDAIVAGVANTKADTLTKLKSAQLADANIDLARANATNTRTNTAQTLQQIMGGKSDAEWSANHPWIVGLGKTVKALSPFTDAASNAAHTANSAKSFMSKPSAGRPSGISFKFHH